MRYMVCPMFSLLLAALYFVSIHVFISGSRLRDRLVGLVGEPGFMGLFSLLSLVGIIWLVQAYRAAPLVVLWASPLWFRPVALVLTLIAFVLVVVGLTTPSPTATGGERLLEDKDAARGILRITRHPFLVGVALWAATHLIASGDAAGTILFAAMLSLALVGPGLIDKKRARRFGPSWAGFASRTSVVPFAAIAAGRNRLVWRELGGLRVALALLLYFAVLALHGWAFGVVPWRF